MPHQVPSEGAHQVAKQQYDLFSQAEYHHKITLGCISALVIILCRAEAQSMVTNPKASQMQSRPG